MTQAAIITEVTFMITISHFQIPKSKGILHPPWHHKYNVGFTVQLLDFLKDKHCKFEPRKFEVSFFPHFFSRIWSFSVKTPKNKLSKEKQKLVQINLVSIPNFSIHSWNKDIILLYTYNTIIFVLIQIQKKRHFLQNAVLKNTTSNLKTLKAQASAKHHVLLNK